MAASPRRLCPGLLRRLAHHGRLRGRGGAASGFRGVATSAVLAGRPPVYVRSPQPQIVFTLDSWYFLGCFVRVRVSDFQVLIAKTYEVFSVFGLELSPNLGFEGWF